MTAEPLIEEREITLHGNAVAYRRGGRGPTMVLLHGIASNNHTWDAVIGELAKTHDVIAPDLIGHGQSAKPMGDYSIGGYATVIRDLLLALEAERVLLVGHSLGGGIAMQLLHMAPDLVGRLVLVSSGGLGRDLGAVLRAASLPGAPLVIRAATSVPAQLAGRAAKGLLDVVGLELPTDAAEGLDGFASLHDPDAREAFLNTVRASTGLGGQRVSAVDKLYLMRGCPLLTIWGERDAIIPVQHAYEVQALVPDMHLHIVPTAGHFPHVDEPDLFCTYLRAFEEATAPSELTLESLGEILRDETDEPELTGAP
ncbi:MAG: alpha/beta fold hydrolase [Solirubrobacteraceae bacterium]|nr:alpha/beta fold hydrolase [Solirubrobacteraceae bacterium]